ncbi:helix-turn-helix domain-containing protein [Streptomyces sp. NPDC056121]|uniref:helix-turn-helix domain-containing protein n=1 Tax=Streptomyces sp. NPDC056121 TaxID=3345718 RepID=UPI0035DE719A
MARRPGRRERPLDPQAGLLERFALELRELQERAGLSYVELAHGAHFASSTLSPTAAGQRLHTREVLLAYVRARGGDVGGRSARSAPGSRTSTTRGAVTALPTGTRPSPSDRTCGRPAQRRASRGNVRNEVSTLSGDGQRGADLVFCGAPEATAW